MARKSKMSILKRQREVKKAEKAAMKREKRLDRPEGGGTGTGTDVATAEDLAGYGFSDDDDESASG